MSELNIDDDIRQVERNPAVERLLTRPDSKADTKIVQQIGREIVSGVYPPETRLPDEARMLQRYGVSRSALREAYAQLAAKGMIIARPKVGTSVRALIHWNMLDPEVLFWHLEVKPLADIAWSLYPLRRMIEPGAASLAAQVRTEDELARIDLAYSQMKAAGTDKDELIEADLRFHLEILSATHNPFIGAFSTLLHTTMRHTLVLGWDGVESSAIKPARLLQHFDVLEAIRQQNPEMAKMRMEILVDDSIKDVVTAINSGDRD